MTGLEESALGPPPVVDAGRCSVVLAGGAVVADGTQTLLCTYMSAVLLGTTAFLKYTRTGKATRAVADNPALSAATGINVERVISIVYWALVQPHEVARAVDGQVGGAGDPHQRGGDLLDLGDATGDAVDAGGEQRLERGRRLGHPRPPRRAGAPAAHRSSHSACCWYDG